MKLICAKREAENFLQRDWTGRNSLIRFRKFVFARKSVEQAKVVSRDGANGSRERAPDEE